MKRFVLVAILLFALVSQAYAGSVTIGVTKSLDDPTPRSSVFPASMSPVFKHYLVEQNGAILPQTCAAGCTQLTVTGVADGVQSFRLGAVVEVTRSDGTKVLSTGWSTAKSITVSCGVPVPDVPEFGMASQVCQ